MIICTIGFKNVKFTFSDFSEVMFQFLQIHLFFGLLCIIPNSGCGNDYNLCEISRHTFGKTKMFYNLEVDYILSTGVLP